MNESLARATGGVAGAVGLGIRVRGAERPMEIVGVVQDTRHNSPRTPIATMLYYPHGQNVRRLTRSMCVLVRTMGAPTQLATHVRGELTQIEPRLPVLRVNTVEEQLNAVLFHERVIAGLSLVFAALGVFLTCLGVYGVIAFTTAQRRNEMGIRVALGASAAMVMRSVLREGTMLVCLGIAVGIPIALSGTRVVSNQLFGVASTDPLTLSLATVLMVAVAGVALFIPARRAAHIDPIIALRTD